VLPCFFSPTAIPPFPALFFFSLWIPFYRVLPALFFLFPPKKIKGLQVESHSPFLLDLYLNNTDCPLFHSCADFSGKSPHFPPTQQTHPSNVDLSVLFAPQLASPQQFPYSDQPWTRPVPLNPLSVVVEIYFRRFLYFDRNRLRFCASPFSTCVSLGSRRVIALVRFPLSPL